MPGLSGRSAEAPIASIETVACTVPTDLPEADGTLEWSRTTVVFVEVLAGDRRGLGYTFADASVELLVRGTLAPLLAGMDAMHVGACQARLLRQTRNLGRHGLVASAISAVDVALWDLKAKLLGIPLAVLFGQLRDAAPVYGSGGFTSYDDHQLERQLSTYAGQGISAVKMKVGAAPELEAPRLRAARRAIGPRCALMVDANGAYSSKQSLRAATLFAEHDVRWFEEPISSDDLEGLRRLRDHSPPGMDIAAGEYGYDQYYFMRMLAAGSVDVLQLDATRCLGYSGFLRAAALAEAHHVPVSAHTAAHLHVPCGLAAPGLMHLEYFHDHARIAELLLDGAAAPEGGRLRADPSRPGHGLELKRQDAVRYPQRDG